MSAGDGRFDDKPGSIAKLRALLIQYPAIGRRLRRDRTICTTFDIPYLGGISRDGKYVYLDRHLPEKIDGILLAKYIEVHESVEQALILLASLTYEPAHHLATAAEQFALLADGYNWAKYEDALEPDFSPLEHENIQRVPPDLDLYPYGGALLKHMKAVQEKTKFTKEEVEYREASGEARRCGTCSMFLPRTGACAWVEGKIEAEYLCNKWESKQ